MSASAPSETESIPSPFTSLPWSVLDPRALTIRRRTFPRPKYLAFVRGAVFLADLAVLGDKEGKNVREVKFRSIDPFSIPISSICDEAASKHSPGRDRGWK
jgi:hypothetical protein